MCVWGGGDIDKEQDGQRSGEEVKGLHTNLGCNLDSVNIISPE